MIRMSLDKETVLPHEVPIKVSPTYPATVTLSEQPQLAKTRQLCPKNGLQPPGNSQPPLTGPPPPAQRIGKRRYSVGVGFKGLAKRRRRANSDSQSEPVLPSHFLLGGNIFDPLNLNSLLDEEVNRATNQETPKCSPLPSRGGDPVEILVPRDITDPLNLKGGGGGGKGGGGVLLSPLKPRRRHRNRHHGGGSGGGGSSGGGGGGGGGVGGVGGVGGGGGREVIPARLFPSTAGLTVPRLTTEGSVSASPLPCELNTAITCRDDVAPPPILPRRHTHPPPSQAHKPGSQGEGRQRRRRRTASTRSAEGAANAVTVATVPQTTKFQTPLVGGAKAGRCGGPHPGSAQPPERKKKDKRRYQYGNHSRYYGYHGFYGNGWEGRVGAEEDPRLCLLEANWFRDKMVLDVGCAAGHMTLSVARRFDPAHIMGVELDERLVHAAKHNVRHFLSHDLVVEERRRRGTTVPSSSSPTRKGGGEREDGDKKNEEEVIEQKEKEEEEVVMEEFQQALSLLSFPLSFRVSRGPLSAPPLLLPPPSSSSSSSSTRFPNNITFIQGDYVSECEPWPGRGQYDVIMCMGVTKWVQLQSGDVGVVRLFKRAYQSLLPGGLFILEPQPWSSYSHSKRASETTYRNYRSIRLRPEHFTSYLTDSVGFTSYRLLKDTVNQRPIYLFHKGPAQRK
ncbi:7SK snRNA methylphosphate capping enzyme [Xiphias gladius]|uniref:7SK snRNA methylphosphate capping enzyme n=1 Tax=Xiphias gladius TaxID=8245 RepID=UPI001A99942D|nr:7SK snRNA methylphosphate capping enzyme [Xiphias gladius]XP_039996673.1 7SK snRNA methylphosphate capping enzyme [Xiphias gladius]XP_039996674.1 7SK snRNA methylphosphate capping enzyme [Xiphias gladius]XP_039996675.1 7SK snRNA methylphosphate capping enzyme [Xiphias gladius]